MICSALGMCVDAQSSMACVTLPTVGDETNRMRERANSVLLLSTLYGMRWDYLKWQMCYALVDQR
jgi:hypothetical protein